MDPLTITLAVVTLATAIKDLVELAQKISDSISQVARNNEDALLLSEEVVDTISQLKNVCEKYQDILENATDMKASLIQLSREMQNTHDKICPLLPRPTERKFGWLKVDIQLWRRRNKIQEEIRKLRDRVSQCYMRFTTFAVMRIEGQLHQLNSGTRSVARQVSIGYDNCRHRSTKGIPSIQISDKRIATFVGSTVVPYPNSPLELTENLISNMYLQFQLENINKLLVDIPTIQFSGIESPTDRYMGSFRVHGHLQAFDRSATRMAVVARTLDIQHVLQSGCTSLTIQEAAWKMGTLSSNMYDLHMNIDSVNTGRWTVQLFRTLAKLNTKVYTPYLIQALHDISVFYLGLQPCDFENGYAAIAEAHLLIKTLHNNDFAEYRILLARILTVWARLAISEGDHILAEEKLGESIDIFEALLRPSFIGDHFVSDASWDSDQERTDVALRDYSRAFRFLCVTLGRLDRTVDAIAAARKSVSVIRVIIDSYPDSYIQEELAAILYILSDPQFRSVIPLREAHLYAQECLTLYRKLNGQDFEAFGEYLYDALSQLAVILDLMELFDEALLLRQEMTQLARRITSKMTLLTRALEQLSESLTLLRRYNEALVLWTEATATYRSIYRANSSEEAHGHFNIAMALSFSGRNQEAVSEAEKAVNQLRALAFSDSEQHLPALARALHLLSSTLDDAGESERALYEGQESLKIYETLIVTRPDLVENYVVSLSSNLHTCYTLLHPTKSIDRSQELCRQLCLVFDQYPKESSPKFSTAMRTYSALLDELGMVQESAEQCNQTLKLFKDHPTNKAECAEGYMECLITNHLLLFSQGDFSRALEAIEKAIKIGMDVPAPSSNLLTILADAKRCRAGILGHMGRYQEALDDINTTIQHCRKNSRKMYALFVCSLLTSSTLHQLNGDPESAATAAREGMSLFSRVTMLEIYQFCGNHLYDLLNSPQVFVDGFIDNGCEEEALIYVQAGIDENMNSGTQLIRMQDQVWHNDLLWCHSLILLAKGDLSDDANLLKVKHFYTKQTEKRPGYALQLSRLLWNLGVFFFYCAQGRHAEGQAVATELKQLVTKLGIIFRNVADVVEGTLARERNRPFWTTTVAKLDLSCHHQQGY